jgi:hypothetical protein
VQLAAYLTDVKRLDELASKPSAIVKRFRICIIEKTCEFIERRDQNSKTSCLHPSLFFLKKRITQAHPMYILKMGRSIKG